jgi:hypothetical protein
MSTSEYYTAQTMNFRNPQPISLQEIHNQQKFEPNTILNAAESDAEFTIELETSVPIQARYVAEKQNQLDMIPF